jgi:predicted RNase H-like HicB family nuclease
MTGDTPVTLSIEFDRETDGRWIAEIPDLPGVMAYGKTQEEATTRVKAIALRVLADRLDHAELGAEFITLTFRAA